MPDDLFLPMLPPYTEIASLPHPPTLRVTTEISATSFVCFTWTPHYITHITKSVLSHYTASISSLVGYWLSVVGTVFLHSLPHPHPPDSCILRHGTEGTSCHSRFRSRCRSLNLTCYLLSLRCGRCWTHGSLVKSSSSNGSTRFSQTRRPRKRRTCFGRLVGGCGM